MLKLAAWSEFIPIQGHCSGEASFLLPSTGRGSEAYAGSTSTAAGSSPPSPWLGLVETLSLSLRAKAFKGFLTPPLLSLELCALEVASEVLQGVAKLEGSESLVGLGVVVSSQTEDVATRICHLISMHYRRTNTHTHTYMSIYAYHIGRVCQCTSWTRRAQAAGSPKARV